MAVTAYWYAGALVQAFDKEVDFLADTIKHTLHTNTYTPNQDTHDYQNDLTNELTTANGYTAGGLTATSVTNPTPSSNVVTWGYANPQWTSSGPGFTARRKVVSDSTPGTTATNPLLWWMDFGQDETASGGGTFTVTEHAQPAAATCADAVGFP